MTAQRKGRRRTAIPAPADIFHKLTAAEDIAPLALGEAPAWAVRHLARRHRLTVRRAALVATLAGLGAGRDLR
jgi:hypothetical protein